MLFSNIAPDSILHFFSGILMRYTTLRIFGVAICWLLVTDGVTAQSPEIDSSGPSDAYISIGTPHTMRCPVRSGGVKPTIHWYRNGTKVTTQFDDPSSLISLADNGNLFFLSFTSNDVGTYYCEASNSFGTTQSRSAVFRLAVIEDTMRREPPNRTNAVRGRSVTITCTPPRGTPEPRVKWRKQNSTTSVLIDFSMANSRFSLEGGNLIINNVLQSDEATYYCIGVNEAGEKTSTPAQLFVYVPPRITQAPTDLHEAQGKSVSFRCHATGVPPPRIKWSKVDDKLTSSRTNVSIENSLDIYRLDPTDEGDYKCTAENEAGQDAAVAHLTIYTAPVFVSTASNKVVNAGRNVSFRCSVTSTPPAVIHWSHQGSDWVTYARQTAENNSRAVDDVGTLTLYNVSTADSGTYKCTAMNVAGTNNMNVQLIVQSQQSGNLPLPQITTRPRDVNVPLGQTARLNCSATGQPVPTIRWNHNGRPVPASNRISITSENLTIRDVMVTDNGMYTCIVMSRSGDVTSSAQLSVTGMNNSGPSSQLPSAPGQPVARPEDVTRYAITVYWVSSQDKDTQVTYSIEYFTKQSNAGWVIAARNLTTASATLNGLKSGTSYIILIRAHNAFGTSEPSPVSAWIKTEGAVVRDAFTADQISAEIKNVIVELNSADVLGSTTLNVTWLVTSDMEYHRYIEGYYIRITSTVAPPITETVHGSFSNYKITTKLQPYTQYKVMVLPFYHTKTGDPSHLKTVTTQEDVPSGPPSDVQVKEVNKYITVTWSLPKPSHRNGVIIGYVIVCNAADYALSRNFTVNSSITNVALDNLARKTEYKIGVAAKTRVGVGIISRMTSIPAQLSNGQEEPPWLKVVIISTLGGVLWVILTILIVCLYRKRKAAKKAKKQAASTISVPLQSANSPTPLVVQYEFNQNPHTQNYPMTMMHQPPTHPHLFNGHMTSRSVGGDLCDYNMDHHSNGNHFKTFYNKPSMEPGPYATTAILNMPERDESQIPQQSPHRNFPPGTLPGSTESCTDNNAAAQTSSEEHSGNQEKRSSTPVLPSFAELLPPPPQYPPPTTSSNQFSAPGYTGTMPAVGACHTCKRLTHHPEMIYPAGYNPRTFNHAPHPHNPHNPHYQQYHHVYPTTRPPMSGSNSIHSYQSYHRGTHSSDSHDYAEPTFELQREPIYGGCPPITHQALPPPHMLHQPQRPVHQGAESDEDGAVCPSCADHTEYEEPWGDQPWLSWKPEQMTGERPEAEALLPQGEAGSESQSQCSHGTNRSQSGSEDSRSDRRKARRRQRAQQLPHRPPSPNGYSTDSSVVFVPRKPYPKSQRRKQMNTKQKGTMKSLAVQVEQEEIPLQQDKV